MDLGPGEILLIAVALALLFGAKRLPELARSLGRAKTEFRRGLAEGEAPEAREATDAAGQAPLD